jgi:hypothetical protein
MLTVIVRGMVIVAVRSAAEARDGGAAGAGKGRGVSRRDRDVSMTGGWFHRFRRT